MFRVPQIGFEQVADAAEAHAYLDEGGVRGKCLELERDASNKGNAFGIY